MWREGASRRAPARAVRVHSCPRLSGGDCSVSSVFPLASGPGGHNAADVGAAGGHWAALPCFQAPPRPGPSLPGFCSWAALRPEQTPPHLTAKGEQGQGCVGTCRPSRSFQLPNHLVGHPLRLS